jgi:hypothetical protein
LKNKAISGFAVLVAIVGVFLTTGSVMRPPPKSAQMQLTSPAFKEGQPIPSLYTCDGKNISPPLEWSGAPFATESFVVIVDDPDSPSGVWTHWVVFDLGADISELGEATEKSKTLAGNAKQGSNSFKNIGYGGPCPPSGKPHRYFFNIYALDAMLDGVNPGATRSEVEAAMEKHILAHGQLMGTYLRK